MSEKTFNAENETQVKGRKRKDEIRRERELNIRLGSARSILHFAPVAHVLPATRRTLDET